VQYTMLGNTGYRVSRLGFGAMRLPMLRIGGKEYVDVERAVQTFHRAFELGVTYVDCGLLYCSEESEFVVAEALARWPRRDEILVVDKCTKMRMQAPGDLRRMLEHQLWKQRRSHFEFYLFHGVGWDNWHEIDGRTGWIADMARAKEEGLLKHCGFSFHDQPEAMRQLVDTGLFELVTCQYNYLDRANEEAISYASGKGMGVVVMGPVGGGRLSVFPRGVRELQSLQGAGAAGLALRFVLSHPGVDVAISGMGSPAMVEANCAAVDAGPLSEGEIGTVNALMEQIKELARLYCTGCEYCLPCTHGVNIPRNFELYNYLKVYGLEEHARAEYAGLLASKADASACLECNECLERCPQHIPIPGQLREVLAVFGGRL
jgi:uncharacterized protein